MLLSVYEKPSTYASAVKWDCDNVIPIQKNKKKEDKKPDITKIINQLPEEKKKELGLIVEKEKTIIKDRIIGTVVICIAGVEKSVGKTHIAMQIATFFASHKERFKVALLQNNVSDHFQKLNNILCCNKVNERFDNSFSFKNIDFFYDTSLIDIKQDNEYDYIIVDQGVLKKKTKQLEMMVNANLSLLICNSKPWYIDIIKNAIFENKEDYLISRKWKLIFNLSDDDFFKYFNQEFKYWETFKMGYCPNLFVLKDDIKEDIYEIVEEVLPVKTVKGGK